jgi:hypothetical protein
MSSEVLGGRCGELGLPSARVDAVNRGDRADSRQPDLWLQY